MVGERIGSQNITPQEIARRLNGVATTIPANFILLQTELSMVEIIGFESDSRNRAAASVVDLSTAEINLLNGIHTFMPQGQDLVKTLLINPLLVFGENYPLLSAFGRFIDKYPLKYWEKMLKKHFNQQGWENDPIIASNAEEGAKEELPFVVDNRRSILNAKENVIFIAREAFAGAAHDACYTALKRAGIPLPKSNSLIRNNSLFDNAGYAALEILGRRSLYFLESFVDGSGYKLTFKTLDIEAARRAIDHSSEPLKQQIPQ